MIVIHVPCEHGTTVLTLREAKHLRYELDRKINQAIAQTDKIKSPARVQAHYIDRDSCYNFFRQIYPAGAVRNRAGRVYAAVVKSGLKSHYQYQGQDGLPIDIICCDCNQPLNAEQCMRDQTHHHYYNTTDYLINVESLKAIADQFMPGGTHELKGAKLEDFRLLLAHL